MREGIVGGDKEGNKVLGKMIEMNDHRTLQPSLILSSLCSSE